MSSFTETSKLISFLCYKINDTFVWNIIQIYSEYSEYTLWLPHKEILLSRKQFLDFNCKNE